jgi:fructose-1,6-bisphosphatase II / sedoheptulose-1,7-bisphosphatase
MDRNLALEVVRVTEAAALSCARLMGRGDDAGAEIAGVQAMRKAFNAISVRGTVIMGEGDEDEMPLLYEGERLGSGNGPRIDVALDALEGATICATGGANALSVITISEPGGLLPMPPIYMEKIATGPEGRGCVDLDKSTTDNLHALAEAKGVYVEDLTAAILDRPRHTELIEEVRRAGARIKLVSDGDVAAALATTKPDAGLDILLGTGGAPQGVLAAAALKCLGGELRARLRVTSQRDSMLAKEKGLDANTKFGLEDLAPGSVMFAATGVTSGDYLCGVRFFRGGATTNSVVMRSSSQTVRLIEAVHHFDFKPTY